MLRSALLESANHWLPGLEPECIEVVAAQEVATSRNYRYTDLRVQGRISAMERYELNLAAIRALKAIQAGQVATQADREALAGFAGWGAIPEVFASEWGWRDKVKALRAEMGEKWFGAARASALNSHYTDPRVVDWIYRALERLGFEGGRILEPSMGIGYFLGRMPEAMALRSEVLGVELDPMVADMARVLYPNWKIHGGGFEDLAIPDGFFDLAISNVPFGGYGIADARYKRLAPKIHDYFFLKALDKVRAGGLVVFITSRGTLDKKNTAIRRALGRKAELLCAVRLPESVFLPVAGTRVTTDVVFLRKRAQEEQGDEFGWQNLGQASEDVRINEYYLAHPEAIVGEMRLMHARYALSPECVFSGDWVPALEERMALVPANVLRGAHAAGETSGQTAWGALEVEAINVGRFVEQDGAILRWAPEGLEVVACNAKEQERLAGLITIRDAVRAVLSAQLGSASMLEKHGLREKLNATYDDFVGAFGPLSLSKNRSAFASDPDAALLLSLEYFDAEQQTARKAEIFAEDTIAAPKEIGRVERAEDALAITLNLVGRVDAEVIDGLLGLSNGEGVAQLRAKGAVYLNPEGGQFEAADAYLSGQVRAKLAAARTAALLDPQFEPNVAALEAVQPARIEARDITVRLGASWVPEEDVEAFCKALFEESGTKVSHSFALGMWQVRGSFNAVHSAHNQRTYGTPRASGLSLLEDALNLRSVCIYDEMLDGKRVLNAEETANAREKQERIKERFAQWIFEDETRRDRLVELYNNKFNAIRPRKFDGSHLTLPGASRCVSLRASQKDGAWRMMQGGNVLLGHCVGAGKSMTIVAGVMELKRLGLISKPVIAVPNNLLEQFCAEFLRLYPAARVLMARKEDLSKDARQVFLSRIATGKFDAIVLTHSSFEKIPTSVESERDYLREQKALIAAELVGLENGEADRRTVKKLERAKKSLETKLKSLMAREKKDQNVICWEDLGVDYLVVDEAHLFKNLAFVTKLTRIAGLNPSSSQRAMDLMLKSRHVSQKHGGRGGICFATATFVANSIAEMYTMQRFLQMDELRGWGLEHFDSWVGTFGEVVSALEIAPDGSGYRVASRLAKFNNLPDLLAMFGQVADIRTARMLNLPRPDLEGGKAAVLVAPSNPALEAYVAGLVERAENLRTMRIDPSIDNMLKITTDGRKAALDMRLVNPAAGECPESKVALAAREILANWERTHAIRGAQLVFCDLSRPRSDGFSVYNDLRGKLVAGGIPEEQIAFIQDYETDAQKAALFQRVRAGKVRVLMGSTAMMGVGTNVQERLVALVHLDAPWRPCDIEQREGRILRQGNLNKEVRIVRCVTEKSFDAYMWQILESKARFIDQVMAGEPGVRSVEDLESGALTYMEVKALASGNPLVLEKAGVDMEVAKLSVLKRAHDREQNGIRYETASVASSIRQCERRIANLRQDIGALGGAKPRVRIGPSGRALSRDEAGKWLELQREMARREAHSKLATVDCVIGNVGGLDLLLQCFPARGSRAEWILDGAGQYLADADQARGVGMIMSIEYLVRSLPERLSDEEQTLSRLCKKKEDLQAQIGRPFEHELRLADRLRRQSELDAELSADVMVLGEASADEQEAGEEAQALAA